MIRRQRSGLIGWFLLSDFLGILISYFYSYGFRFFMYIIPVNPERGIPPLKSYVFVFPLFLAIHFVIFFLQGFYRTRLKRTKIDDFFLVTLNAILTILIIQAILAYLNAYSQGAAPLFRVTFKLSHGFLAVYFVVVVLMISFLRNQIFYFMKKRYAKGMNLKSVLVVGAGAMGKSVAEKLSQYKDLGFVVKGFLDDDRRKGEEVEVDGGIPVLGPVSDLESILEKGDVSDVYVALDLNNYGKILETLKVINKYVVNVRLIPDLFQLLTLKARVEDLDGFPVISVDEPPLRGMMLLAKRLMDIVVSATFLLFFSPFLLIITLLIKLTSKGPVLYHQERMGLDGKKFVMHKFRTMVSDAESKTGPVMCSPDDPRITRIGKFLRKFSLDEIPQLVNVLKGEMSLVGPRPERPVFVKEFREEIPKYMLRHKVKSGVTGWAQVHGLRQDTSIDKRLEYDFYYIQNWSLSLDLKILWKTLRKGFIDKNL
ncbi:MAG: undecaprenyl-phosphate glucose phosphotransferase [Candidatus Aminicenantes bacterium]|nr:MAG: undecaprenyl-phosphate glucose phosphotransferase [Candidatus Aminicenantes bacterium]